jgi:hypothetical protein
MVLSGLRSDLGNYTTPGVAASLDDKRLPAGKRLVGCDHLKVIAGLAACAQVGLRPTGYF